MDTISIDAFTRDVVGKKVVVLRRKGITPLHLYGKGMESMPQQADSATVAKLIRQVGHHMPLYLKLEGGTRQELVFVQEVQRHPVTNRILHVDLHRVDITHSMKGEVPITLVGEAPAVHVHRGTLIQSLHYLSVECLPMDMPERVEVDISHLEELDQVVRVKDLAPRPGITVLSEPEEAIVRISPPRVEEEEKAKIPAVEEKTEGE